MTGRVEREIPFSFGPLQVHPRVHVARIRAGLGSLEDLLEAVGVALGIPEPWSRNLNALYDYLCDLSWITADQVYLVHDDVPCHADIECACDYLDILASSVQAWQQDGGVCRLRVAFPLECRSVIEEIVDQCEQWGRLEPENHS